MKGTQPPPGGGTLLLRSRGPLREIRLNRPEVHNALDEELIAALTDAFREVAEATRRSTGEAPRGVLLSAEGKSFCAGADLHYMRRIGTHGEIENLEDARRLAALFRSVRECPVFVLGRIQGTALGGGCGLVAACDLALASSEARFGFTEVRLGIVPATISPFVVERIGSARARALFPTGEIFDAMEAHHVGLVDRVVPAGELDASVDRVLEALLQAAPEASREAKALADVLAQPEPPEGRTEWTARMIARLRARPEGREGMAAFLEKRPPAWRQTIGSLDPGGADRSPGRPA